MREIFRSNDIEIRFQLKKQIIIRGPGNSEFNNHLNKHLDLLPPTENLRIINDQNRFLAKLSFDQWNLIVNEEIETKKFQKLIDNLNSNSSTLATDYSDAQVFFRIMGSNRFKMLNKLTHFDFREKSFKALTAAQTLLARIDCSIFNFDDYLYISCNRSFSEYLEDRLIDAINF